MESSCHSDKGFENSKNFDGRLSVSREKRKSNLAVFFIELNLSSLRGILWVLDILRIDRNSMKLMKF